MIEMVWSDKEMNLNDKETFQGDHLWENIGTGHALTIYDHSPNEANSSDNRGTFKIWNKVKPKIRERLLNFNAFEIQLKGS